MTETEFIFSDKYSSTAKTLLLILIKIDRPFTPSELVKAIGITQESFDKALKELNNSGLLRINGKAH